MNKPVEYCNWTFLEVIKRKWKWGIQRDCDTTPLVQQTGIGPYDFDEGTTLVLTRGDTRNWKSYEASLEPQREGEAPSEASKCPKCGRYVNGVNPYDDGETWRM